jgi:NAD kinase
MKIAVYSLLNSEACKQTVHNFISHIQELAFEVAYEQRIARWIDGTPGKVFTSHDDLDKDTDLFFSIGGDGTLLRSLEFIRAVWGFWPPLKKKTSGRPYVLLQREPLPQSHVHCYKFL